MCCGAIGADELGEMFQKALEKEGISSEIVVITEKYTYCNVILHEAYKDRRYLFSKGANACVLFGEIPSIGLVGKDFIEVIQCAKQNYNSRICLDTLVSGDEDYAWMSGYWQNIDFIHCNKGEGCDISKQGTLENIALWIMDQGIKLGVITDGAQGCCYTYQGVFGYQKAYEVKEVDATGAGDAMTAGIISKLLSIDKYGSDRLHAINQHTIDDLIQYGSALGKQRTKISLFCRLIYVTPEGLAFLILGSMGFNPSIR